MKQFYKKLDRYVFMFIATWLVNSLGYFIISWIDAPAVSVWCPWDASIPFVPFFITFYIGWFLYIAVGAITLWHFHRLSQEDHREFIKFMLLMGVGLLTCLSIFIVFPTQIPEGFRGDLGDRSNVFTWLVGIIYDTDELRNAFPSEHCFVAITLCWGFLRSPAVKRSKHRYWLYPANIIVAVGICMSTMFVKQHSIIDFFGALGLFIILVAIIYCIPWKKRSVN
ncbi:MAG: phosphatase PAP2 family protein [Eubacteriales bacterium]|nr:phosphatase PAP2 family protein [Eubacteriales bacterium]